MDEISDHRITLREAFWVWVRVAIQSFGGPAGQIAVMHRIIVDEKKWISEQRFLHALNYCMLLPGPEAQQLATYIGWLMHGTRGGILAGTLFILPGAIAILLLSLVYATWGHTPFIAALFFGLKPAVIAIVIQAIVRIGKRILVNRTMFVIAATAFVSIYFFSIPFPLLIGSGALTGYIGGRLYPKQFSPSLNHKSSSTSQSIADSNDTHPHHDVSMTHHLRRSLSVSIVCLTLWFAPLVVIAYSLGTDSVFSALGAFFSKAAVVTFGGAYSVLAYVAQQAVQHFHWLSPTEMLDGLALAETTPGPLIMVVQFVGFMAAYRNPGPLPPLLAGTLGSVITTWVTFVPCFYFVFLGAPYIERLRANRSLGHALSAITASVVGVILNLTLWFAIHTLFQSYWHINMSWLKFEVPIISSLDWRAAFICIVACCLMFRWKWGTISTLAASVAIGGMLYFVTILKS